jgi:AcrR family transcriptional regulator
MTGVKGQVQARGVERRRAIVDAATELFSRSGYHDTSLADIARRVGIARSAIVHHFGSKEQLLVAVLRAIDRRTLAQIGTGDTPTTRDAFLRWADVARWCEGEGRDLTLLTVRMETENVLGSDLAREHFAARDRSIHALLVMMLRAGIRRGDLQGDIDIEAKAAEMLAFGSGAAFTWLKNPDQVSLTDLHTTYFEGQYALLAAS